MSAIAGVIYFDGPGPALENVIRMTDYMKSRGPDGISHWSAPGVALGYCQLCTTPESLAEKQPLLNEDQTAVLVFAGRVDNRSELRSALVAIGWQLRDETDAELVLKSWQTWGNECPDRIIGDFVFFIWDVNTRTLFGARDVAGNRHFHYVGGDGWFAFASEAKALVACGLASAAINEYSILDYLSEEYDRFDESAGMFRDIRKLPLGTAITVSPAGTSLNRYWQPENLVTRKFSSRQDYLDAFRHNFEEAVACRLRSNGPVGACLSGGIDSSAIVSIISAKLSSKLTSPLHTYSLVHHDRDTCADWPYIRIMQRLPDISATTISSDMTDDLCRAMLEIIPGLDNPYALGNSLSELIIAMQANLGGCRVLLDGMAGDMLFLSPKHSLEYCFRFKRLDLLPSVIAAHYRHKIPGAWKHVLKKSLRPLIPGKLLARYRQRQDEFRAAAAVAAGGPFQLLAPAVSGQWMKSRLALSRQWAEVLAGGRMEALELLWLTSPMLCFAYEMNESAFCRHNMEQRGPFSDRRLMELALTMPFEAMLSRGMYKSTLRDSLGDLLPPEIGTRKTAYGHPGWSFYQRLFSYCMTNASEFLEPDCLHPTLSRLTNPVALAELRHRSMHDSAFSGNVDLLRLAVLNRWLHTIESPE